MGKCIGHIKKRFVGIIAKINKNSDDIEYNLAPYILLEDFVSMKNNGIQYNGKSYFKYDQDLVYININESNLSEQEKQIMSKLNIGDAILFDGKVKILEEYRAPKGILETYRYLDFDVCASNIKELNQKNAKDKIESIFGDPPTRYCTSRFGVFLHESPSLITEKQFKEMLKRFISPKAISVYLASLCYKDDIWVNNKDLHLLTDWDTEEIEKGLEELVDHGYMEQEY